MYRVSTVWVKPSVAETASLGILRPLYMSLRYCFEMPRSAANSVLVFSPWIFFIKSRSSSTVSTLYAISAYNVRQFSVRVKRNCDQHEGISVTAITSAARRSLLSSRSPVHTLSPGGRRNDWRQPHIFGHAGAMALVLLVRWIRIQRDE